MTGYAIRTTAIDGGELTVELRSVNARFVDLNIRLPDEWRPVEPRLRDAIASSISRGKLECRVQWRAADRIDPLRVQVGRLHQLDQAIRLVRARVDGLAPMTVADVLRWPGVLGAAPAPAPHDPSADAGDDDEPPVTIGDRSAGHGDDGPDTEPAIAPAIAPDIASGIALETAQEADPAAWAHAEPVVRSALAEFVGMREREGRRLAAAVTASLQAIEAEITALRPRVPAIIAHARERLVQRLRDALGQTQGMTMSDDDMLARIGQEVALLGLKADVAEEIDRLHSHVSEARHILERGGAVGKRLDFLCQEMNREANTIGSKAIDLAMTDASVTLKLLVEQIREQAQNLE